MTTVLPFGSNTITTFAYESFSYTISNPGPYTLTISNTPGLQSGYLTNNGSNVVFATSSNALPIGGTEVFAITASSGGTTVGTSVNTVSIKAGRFQDASGTGFVGSNFTFYKNEPITPVQLIAPFAIATPTAQPAIPTGLTYTSNASNVYSITGTPFTTVPQSNYLIIGKATGTNSGKIISSSIPISVSNERILLNLSGTPVISPMTIGTPISNRVLTARFPPYPSGGILRYAWFGLPDGIIATDNTGTPVTSPFSPIDPSSTLIITGTPTLAAAYAYKNADITSNAVSIGAFRTFPSPQITNEQTLVFAFGETVLFEPVTVPTLYDGVTISSGSIYFQAQTYFGSSSPIASIVSPDLRSDLSLSALYGPGRVNLTGTPSGSLGTATYTIRATNSNGVFRDLQVPITVAADSISFVSPPTPVDVCYTYVLSRPSSLALTGYYPSSVQFQATAASGNAVSFSAPGLVGTGLSLSNVTANTVQIVGIPDTVTALKNVRVTATATGTPATAFRDISLAVLNDVITIADVSASQLSFVQNRAITPIQFTASTLSERPVIAFTSIDLPSGLLLSTTGRLTGTPTATTSGTFTVTASTGYASQGKVFTYTLTPDSALFLVNPTTYTYSPLDSVFIQFNGLTYSGSALSNYTVTGFTPNYGLTVGSSTGVMSGTLQSGIPPDPLFPTSAVSFSVTAQSGLLSATLPSTFTVSNPVVHRSFLLVHNNVSEIGGAPANPGLWVNDDSTLSNWAIRQLGDFLTLARKNDTVDSNTYLLTAPDRSVWRSTDGVNFTSNYFGDSGNCNTPYKAINLSNSSNWVLAGTGFDVANGIDRVFYFTSSDDGVTWTRRDGLGLRMAPRSSNLIANYYTTAGIAFAIQDGVWLLGGGSNGLSGYWSGTTSMLRSTDEGSNWSQPSSKNWIEVAAFNTDASRWIRVGSDSNSLGDNTGSGYFNRASETIAYSDDQGASWMGVTGTYPDIGTYDIAYASGRWIAVGMQYDDVYNISTQVVWSSDGQTWSNVSLPITFTQYQGMHLPEVGPIWSDGSNWNLFVKRNDSASPTPVFDCKLFTHSLTGDLGTGWVEDVSGITPLSQGPNYISSFLQNYVRLGVPTTATLAFNSLPAGGPTLVSPTQTDYTVYQYVAITPITFTASGVGRVYYFVVTADLPTGISFDPITATLSGTSVVLGQKTFTIYAKDSVGVTRIVVSINTILPRVIRQQTSAGAWTSLVRQYTVVNGAENSVNNRTVPATYPPLGEFTRPYPPDSVDASGNPNCEICP